MKNASAPSKFKKVLVIDDDELDIYVSKRIIKNSSFADVVITTTTVKDAMDYLMHNSTLNALPDFIFLDLNMPEQNGLDFLEAFADFAKEKNVNCTIALLMNVVQTENTITKKAKSHPLVKYVFEKPLTEEMLKRI